MVMHHPEGIQGPPKPANHTMHRTFDPQFDAQSAMWTIDGTRSFVSHWEDKREDPAPVELGYTVSRILPGDGPRFVAVQYRTTAQLRSPGHDITPVVCPVIWCLVGGSFADCLFTYDNRRILCLYQIRVERLAS